MALPSKKSKLNINLEPPKVGTDYLKYGFDRIEELMVNSDKRSNFLPRTIDFDDIDINLNSFVKEDKLKLTIDGNIIPTFYLENDRWGEFSKTWKMMDGDKNVPTPYITIRRVNKSEGSRVGKKYAVPQNKAFKYIDVPIQDEGQVIYLRFKIPEPTNVDLFYDVKLFTKYRVDVNDFDELVMRTFKSRQEYLFVKGNPMPVLLEEVSENNTVENIDGDKYYVSTYQLKVQGFLQSEEEFEITKTSREPNFGIDLSTPVRAPIREKTENIDLSDGLGSIVSIRVRNTDDSYDVNVDNDLILPDINILDYSNSILNTFPSVQDISFSAITTPSFAYPQITQEVSYRTGDEGWQLANVWNNIYTGSSNTIRSIIGLRDFYTLESPNRFGNYARFTTTGGTPITVAVTNGDIFQDNYLGLYLYRAVQTNISWNDTIDTSLVEGDGTWYLPPFAILMELIDWENSADSQYNDILPSSSQWTSTTNPKLNTEGQRVFFGTTEILYPQILNSNNKDLTNAGYGLLYKPIPDNTVGITLDTINISNSDNSYSANTAGNTVLPDIQINDYNGTSQSYPSVKDIDVSAVTTPSYAYPQLTQETSYYDFDEGWQLQNLWKDIYTGNSNTRRSVVGLADFYTLEAPNQFGNTTRFTRGDGTPVLFLSDDQVVYDNYLGIQFVEPPTTGFLDWEGHIDAARAYGDGSWYPVPLTIWLEWNDAERGNRFNDVINKSGTWTSTTDKSNTTRAYDIDSEPLLNVNIRSKTPAFWRATVYYKPITSTTFANVSTLNNVSNSDDSFTTNISDDLELPDIQITDYTGGTTSYPSVQNLSFSGITPIEIAYHFPRLINRVGGMVSYRDGDAGWVEQNIYSDASYPTVGRIPRLVDYYTLEEPNVFGNFERFTNITGGTITSLITGAQSLGTQTYSIDHFTGLGWTADLINGNQDTTWNDAIDYATGYTTEGFTDFHLPSVEEFFSVATYLDTGSDFWRGFLFGWAGGENTEVWTSQTTAPVATGNAVTVGNGATAINIYNLSSRDKTDTNRKYYGVCRKHF